MSENLTVLQVIPALDTGGAERTAVDVAAALVMAGGTALVASEGGRMLAQLAAVGAEHVALPLGSKNPLTMARNAGRLAGLIRRRRVGIVHARSRAPAWSALAAARLTGTPFVTTYHGAYSQTWWPKGLYNSVMARADTVIANSRYTAALIAGRHPFARDRIAVIHRGSDLSAFDAAAINPPQLAALAGDWRIGDGERVILNMARLTHWKGQTVLIDALERLAGGGSSGWTAILAGDDQGRTGYKAELAERIARAGLAGRVRLVGHCDDVAGAMALADVVVVASTEPEAFGRAAVEAQASGKPVVVSDLGAAPETVRAPPDCTPDQRTGWRVPAGDAPALAAAIATVLALSQEQRSALAARARAHVEAQFSLKAMTDATLSVYDRLVAEAAAAPRGIRQGEAR